MEYLNNGILCNISVSIFSTKDTNCGVVSPFRWFGLIRSDVEMYEKSITSSQETTVGPSHWANARPFFLASSRSSCLYSQRMGER